MISITDRLIEIGQLKPIARGFEVFAVSESGETQYLGKAGKLSEATAMVRAARAQRAPGPVHAKGSWR